MVDAVRASRERPRLLFVDDEETIRLTLSSLLDHHGFDVTAVADVADALVHISAVSFDAMITDLNIEREGDGFLVVAAMRRAQPNCRNFILTGYPSLENAVRAIHNQVDDYFTKPADIEELVGKVKARLTTPRQQPIRLAVVLMEKEREITSAILESVKKDPLLRKARLKDGERVDHLPAIFQAIITRLLNEGRPFTTKELRFASLHGRRRKKYRYTPMMLVREFQVIGETIQDLLGTPIVPLTAVEISSDLKLLMQSLNAFTLVSFKAYSKAK